MKYNILISLFLFTSCISKKSNSILKNDTYLIQLEKFDSSIESTLQNNLNNKTFSIQDKEIKQSTTKKGGNTFYINTPFSDFKKTIKVKNISKDSSELKVNITFFKNENQQLNQYFNSGDFDLSKLDEKDKVEALEELIVTLTFI